MAEATLRTFEGEEKGKVQLPDSSFGVRPKEQAVYEAVKSLMANNRQGTSSTKTRHEVSGSGSKPWRQKGTGRARSGTSTSPLWVGGGRIHGPRPRDYTMRIPKKVRRLALLSVLSDRARDGAITVIDRCPELTEPKSKTFSAFWKRNAAKGEKCLLVIDKYDENVFKSVRNLARLEVTTAQNLNTVDALRAVRVIFTADALKAFERTE
jgi:large subunit ribosomal protein L4